MKKHLLISAALLCACVTAFFCIGCSERSNDDISLETLFDNPPQEAKPLMIWQWMDGVVTKEGITADLEAYKAAGIGGVQQFLVGGPLQCVIKDPANAIGTDNWRELMIHAIKECQRLGLSFGTHNCPGWSASAFPTILPEESMQKLVWSEILVDGGKSITIDVPQPEPDTLYHYYKDIVTLAMPADSVVKKDEIVVFAAEQNAWEAPEGQWRIIRFGHTTTGKTNWGTAPEGGVGLECDKMSRSAVHKFWESYPTMLLSLVPEANGTTFKRFEMDSFEAGGQDWTPLMPEEFSSRRGYDIVQWLPVLAGITIDDKDSSDKFYKDFVETATDLVAENYYGYLADLAHETPGLELLAEPYGTGGTGAFGLINTEKIMRQSQIDKVAAEFWTRPNWGWPELPGVAQSAYRNGRTLVYAEGFTCWPLSAWTDDPRSLKPIADRAFYLGVNGLMLHAGAHNPWPNVRPGMSFGTWGTQFNYGQTWWMSGGANLFFTYLARCEAMLQQGVFVDNTESQEKSLVTDNDSLAWIHRKTPEADIYFVANKSMSPSKTVVTISVTGKQPEIWNPETGERTLAKYWVREGNQTKVALDMCEQGSLFVILKEATTSMGTSLEIEEKPYSVVSEINNDWLVQFPEGWGAPESITLDTLMSWSESAEAGVRYFSGSAVYSKTINVASFDAAKEYVLDLGVVDDLANICINGSEIAHLWKYPYRCDVTSFLKEGENTLQIEVTNLWVNRMIGDEEEPSDIEWSDLLTFGNSKVGYQMLSIPDWLKNGTPRPSKGRYTVMNYKVTKKGDPLISSGLLGPVRLLSSDK